MDMTRSTERILTTHVGSLPRPRALLDLMTAENAHAVRLKVEVRKWIASKILPKVYGDRVRMDVSLDANVHTGNELPGLAI